MIPKIIHYCWLSNDPVPEKLQKCMKSWKERLNDYEFILWNFNRFDINSSLWVKQAFELKKYASAADFIRLYAVYNYGGIYLDMDIEVIKPFDELLNSEYMIAYENNESKAIEAGCFGAIKGARYIKECLDWFKDKEFTAETISMGYTLPKIMKNVLAEYFEKTGIETFKINTEDYFTAKSLKTKEVIVTDNTYCIHHFAGSWKNESINEKKWAIFRKKTIKLFGYTIGCGIAFIYFIVLCIFTNDKKVLRKIINEKLKII